VSPGGGDFTDISTDYGGSGTQAMPTPGFWTASVVPEPPAAAIFGVACLLLALATRLPSLVRQTDVILGHRR
jgi:hypothetical protein